MLVFGFEFPLACCPFRPLLRECQICFFSTERLPPRVTVVCMQLQLVGVRVRLGFVSYLTNPPETFQRDRVETYDASVESLEEFRIFFSCTMHVDDEDRVVVIFQTLVSFVSFEQDSGP